jgi:mRNA interferase RelE/StbE
MGYGLIYTKSAWQDIKKLDRVAQKKLAKALERLREKPFFYAKKLILPQLGGYRYRIGNYRVIFDIEDKKIIILRVGHRKEIYR